MIRSFFQNTLYAVRDGAIATNQVRITIIMKDPQRLEKHIEHSIGGARNPMTNTQREAKFAGLVEGALPQQRRRLMPDAAQPARGAAV